MYKIGIIGDRHSVYAFAALGFQVFEAEDAASARAALRRAATSEEYAVIYIIDTLAATIEDEIARYRDLPLPAITVLPGGNGSTGYAINNLRLAAERAAGVDILK